MPRLAIVLILIAALSGTGTAIERVPLPAVDLVDREGDPVRADRIGGGGRAVLIYVHASCPGCEAVLSALEGMEWTDDPPRVIVIAEGHGPDGLTALAVRFPRLGRVQWLADPAGALGQRIAPQLMATIIGVQAGIVEWTVAGVVTSRAQLRTLAESWLTR